MCDSGVFDSPLESLPNPLPIPVLNQVRPKGKKLTIRTPGSKSLTNRALLLAGLAQGESFLRQPLLDADDARQMIVALGQLGAKVSISPQGDAKVQGVAGRWCVPNGGVTLNLNNAGTATRFLAASSVLATNPVTIDGNDRMRQRPIAELGDLITQLGAGVSYLNEPGFVPMCVEPIVRLKLTDGAETQQGTTNHAQGGIDLTIPPTRSSQFISALLLIGPWLPGGLTIHLQGTVTSPSYIAMTVGLLDQIGARVRVASDYRLLRVSMATPVLESFEYKVEPDASSATYFLAAAAMFEHLSVEVCDLAHSLQGDARFGTLLEWCGTKVEKTPAGGVLCTGSREIQPVLADLSEMPDAAMTLGAVMCFAKGSSILRGLATLRDKECDRIQAMVNEFARIGVEVETRVGNDDGTIRICPPDGGVDCSPNVQAVEFDTYDDHRMAMALSLIGLRRPRVSINDPACVAKTYPTYWRDFAKLFQL